MERVGSVLFCLCFVLGFIIEFVCLSVRLSVTMHLPAGSRLCLVLLLVFLPLFWATLASALPARAQRNRGMTSTSDVRQRRSGYSDQRLAELETIFALADMSHRRRISTNPQVGFGVVDIHKIGKRKRSSEASSEPERVAESRGVLLDRVLRRLRNLSPTAELIEDDGNYGNSRFHSNR